MRVATHCTCDSHKLSRVNTFVFTLPLGRTASETIVRPKRRKCKPPQSARRIHLGEPLPTRKSGAKVLRFFQKNVTNLSGLCEMFFYRASNGSYRNAEDCGCLLLWSGPLLLVDEGEEGHDDDDFGSLETKVNR